MWSRRDFVRSAGAGAAGAVLASRTGAFANAPSAVAGPLRGRFLTHVSVVRVNQIEVTPTRNLGQDESADNTTANMRLRRGAFARGCPGGRMTWAISWLALYDPRQQYKDVRRLLAEYHDKHGDEVTFIPGGYFAPMYATREDNRKTIHQALQDVSKMVGGGYRPDSLVAGFMDAENQQHLANEEGIHVCQGQIWSQHGIDNGDGDGGICYPYYPSREHYLKPAQGKADFIDCVCLDGWTCDFFTARREGFEGKFNSRQGVGPIETVQDLGEQVGRKEMMDTTAMHFDSGYALNGFGFVTSIWELSLGNHQHLEWWLGSVRERWPDTQVMTEGAFGREWRKHTPDNSKLNYRFDVQGTGAPGSEKDLEIEWYMNREFRLELLGPVADKSQRMAIDFTRYDLPAHEPQGPQREWSLMNVLNQKGTRPQDKPKRLGSLPEEGQKLIFARYPELKKLG
jgi:hypothetical protein